tara:strand:- start:1609 stop:2757 length:1149 start_codon:yes stop_codon:yes gene_type:complete
LLLPIIARIFGPNIIGEIGLAQSIGFIFLIVLEYGFSISGTKKVANESNILSNQMLAGQIYSFKLYLLPIVFAITYILCLVHPIFIKKPYLLIISTIDVVFQSFIPSWYFKGKEKFKFIAITKFCSRSISFLAIFFLVKSPEDSWVYLALIALSSLVIALTQILVMINEIGKITFCSWSKIKPILPSSSYNFIITLLPTLFNNIGILILSYISSPLQLGYYFGVSKIYRAFNTLYTPIFESLFPYFVKLYNNDKTIAKSKMKVYNVILSVIGFSFLFIIWFFSSSIINILLGANFLVAEKYLKAFGFLLPLTVIAYIWGNQWMPILGKEKVFAQISAFSNLIGILALFLLMQRFLIFSIPMAIAISEIIKIFMIFVNLKNDK